MTLFDELYFEITFTGTKSEIKRLASFLRSGDLDDFFEIERDYINFDDNYTTAEDSEETSLIFTNDDFGIEIDEFDTDEFLDTLCRAAKALDVQGTLYDADDGEYSFISEAGDGYYVNSKSISKFNDELDEHARKEESDED